MVGSPTKPQQAKLQNVLPTTTMHLRRHTGHNNGASSRWAKSTPAFFLHTLSCSVTLDKKREPFFGKTMGATEQLSTSTRGSNPPSRQSKPPTGGYLTPSEKNIQNNSAFAVFCPPTRAPLRPAPCRGSGRATTPP